MLVPLAITITDNNNTFDVQTTVRLFDQTLQIPTFLNRGSGYEQASAEINKSASDGFADFSQNGPKRCCKKINKTSRCRSQTCSLVILQIRYLSWLV